MTTFHRYCRFFALALGFIGTAQGQVFQNLHDFSCIWSDQTGWDCSRGGIGPKAALTQGRDGNFYGTTSEGGPWGCGAVFKMMPEGQTTTLAFFDGTNGCSPYGALLQASDGNLYGSTLYGGGPSRFFRVTLDGSITNLFKNTFVPAYYPLGDFVEGPDGWIYGVSQESVIAQGAIFRFTTNGAFQLLHLFSGGDGAYPSGGLLLASDGNFYGVTVAGGSRDFGTVYRLTTNGVLTTIASFSDLEGAAIYPSGRLVEAPDGSLYGVSDSTADIGAVFRVTREGALTTVADFLYFSAGEVPVGPLVIATDGNIYGCCHYGGDLRWTRGTVFRMTVQNGPSALFPFTGYWPPYPGAYPYAGLLLGRDGNLYGSTYQGGDGQAGNIFRIIMPGNECSLTCPTNVAVCNDPGQCGALVNFGPPLTTNCAGYVMTSVPPSGSFFPIGTNTVQWTAVDSASGQLTNTCTFVVIVHDAEPPVIHNISATPASLWPPNHKMQAVTLRVSATDNCHVARSRITSVSSNEGSTADWQITGDLTVNLRAERSGRTGNRVYSITVECVDGSGNSITAVTEVGVPH